MIKLTLRQLAALYYECEADRHTVGTLSGPTDTIEIHTAPKPGAGDHDGICYKYGTVLGTVLSDGTHISDPQ